MKQILDEGAKALRKITGARTRLMIRQPFFGTLALNLRIVESTNPFIVPTMGTDGRVLMYWPPFVNGLTDDECMGVVAHEAMHCALQHMTRRGHRIHRIYNEAGDYVINAELLGNNFKLPASRLYDKKFDNMSTEEVYERIKQQAQDGTGSGQKGGGGQGGNKGAASGQGQPKDGDTAENAQGNRNDPGGCGSVHDAGSLSNEPGNVIAPEQIAHEWEILVHQAAAIAKAAGKLPGFAERMIGELKRPRINWRELLRRFIDGTMSNDYSWQRPNRRHINAGLHLPGFIPDRMHHLVMILDVSGSVTNDMMAAFGGETAGALAEGVADRLSVVYADTHVKKVDEYVPGDIVEIKSPGGGGTDFRDAMNWVRTHAQDAACVVYLTDLITSDWGEAPECPLLWGAYLPTDIFTQIKDKIPFGEVIHVDAA